MRLGPPGDERLEGGLAASIIAYLNGANIIRTHDVKETKQTLSMVESIYGNI